MENRSLAIRYRLLLKLFHPDNEYAVLNVAERYSYEEGKRTDIIAGYIYEAANLKTYEIVSVFVKQSKPLISQQQLDELRMAKKKVLIAFENTIVKPYYNERLHTIVDSIKADSVSFCKDSDYVG